MNGKIIFDNVFMWHGFALDFEKDEAPDSCCRLQIIDFDSSGSSNPLFRWAVIVSDLKEHTGGILISNCAEGLFKRISENFDLDPRRLIWIEHYPGESMEWVRLEKTTLNSGRITRKPKRRPINSQLVKIIAPFEPEIRKFGSMKPKKTDTTNHFDFSEARELNQEERELLGVAQEKVRGAIARTEGTIKKVDQCLENYSRRFAELGGSEKKIQIPKRRRSELSKKKAAERGLSFSKLKAASRLNCKTTDQLLPR